MEPTGVGDRRETAKTVLQMRKKANSDQTQSELTDNLEGGLRKTLVVDKNPHTKGGGEG